MIIISCLSIILHNAIALYFFDLFLERNPYSKRSIFYIVFMILSLSLGIFVSFHSATWQVSLLTLINLYVLSLFYTARTVYKIVYIALLFIFMSISELLAGFILMLFGITIEAFISTPIFLITLSVLSLVMLFGFVTVARILKNNALTISKNLLLLLYPITTFIYLLSLYHFVTYGHTKILDKQQLYFLIFIIVLVLLSNVAIIYLIRNTIQYEVRQKQLDFIDEYLKLGKQHQEDLIQLNRKTKKIRHDLKNGLLHISGLLRSGNYNACQDLLNRLLGTVSNLENKIMTGFDGLDAVISTKITLAESKNIKFHHFIILPEKNNLLISEYDLSLICANILDNAIEASENCPHDHKEIEFQMTYEPSIRCLRLYCMNSTIHSNMISKTTKRDTENHGFGLDNISDLVKKWNGTLFYEISDQKFIIVISLYNA